MSMSHVSMSLHGDIAVVTMDDGKVNAMNSQLTDALWNALDEAESQALAVVLSGRPRIFSAGLDLNVLAAGREATVDLLHRWTEILLRLAESPRPLVAACTGHALASGALMLLCCDVRIGAVGDYQIGMNEVALGMSVPELEVELARARLSPRHLTMACNTARIYSPDEAVDAGFLDRVTTGDVCAEALAVATGLALRLDPEAFAKTRRRTCRRLTDTVMRTSGELFKIARR